MNEGISLTFRCWTVTHPVFSLFSHNREAKVMTVFSVIKNRMARYSIIGPDNPVLHHLKCNGTGKGVFLFSRNAFNGLETSCDKMCSCGQKLWKVLAMLHKEAHTHTAFHSRIILALFSYSLF